MRDVKLASLCSALLLAAACNPLANKANAPGATTHGLELSAIDRSVKPGDDFFGYADGAWVKATQIPPDRSTYGAFAALREVASKRAADLIKGAADQNAAPGTETRKIADYYASYMDEAGIDKKGLAPIKPQLDAIAAVNDRSGLARLIGSTVRADVDALNNTNFHTPNLFGVWVSPDFADANRNVAYLMQGGLGLPDRDFYLKTDPKMTALQAQYRAHIAKVLQLAGVADAEAKAQRIYTLERKIAESHVSRADSEDVHKANNPWAAADFAKKAPGMDWTSFFQGSGLAGQPKIMVWQPKGVSGISRLVASEPLDVWKDYLTFHALDHDLNVLPKPFRDEAFAFYDQTLSGQAKPRDRWKVSVDAVNTALGDAVGKLYVEKYFPPEAKAKIQAMVANIKDAFGRRIDRLGWMSPATKARAKEKLATLYIGLGYPEKWQDYSGLEVASGEPLANRDRAELFNYRQMLARLSKPVDRSQWWMTPQTVNAVNLPLQNALNFPAAILLPPFFDKDGSDIENYGGIGVVIGHEISHSFDDQGSQFDAYGNLVNWWTPRDAAHFKDSSERLARQYDAYEPLPGLHINGHLTLSENIADVAGLSASYDAYRASLGGKEGPAAQGFTGDQRFFLSFAQTQRYKAREQALRNQILTDGHSPSPWRAATVRNVDAWYPAFQVQPGQKLYLAPADRVRVW
jgi:putative endopeptidase